jgi:hypothetical protein
MRSHALTYTRPSREDNIGRSWPARCPVVACGNPCRGLRDPLALLSKGQSWPARWPHDRTAMPTPRDRDPISLPESALDPTLHSPQGSEATVALSLG